MASVREAMKKHQADQAAAQAATKTTVRAGAPDQEVLTRDQSPDTAPTAPEFDKNQSPGTAVPGLEVANLEVAEATPINTANPITAAPTIAAPVPPTVAAPRETPKYAEILRPHFDRGGRIAEEYRALRTNLLAQCEDKGFCYLVTSAEPGEGKTLTVLNLALVLGECVTQNVLVIEADLRRPRIASLLDLAPSPGLAELLRGEATFKQVIMPTSYQNFSVVPAGHAAGDEVGELLGYPPMHTLMGEARRMFDYVLVDTPPINLVSDAGALGRFCHEALFVVRMGKTRQDAIDHALALLRSANIKPAGMILTGSNESKPAYPYRYAS